MISKVLFDLDGTLTDPKEGFVKSILYSLNKMGRRYEEDISAFIGPPLHVSLAKILNTKDEKLITQATEFYRESYSSQGLFENFVYPDMASVLETLTLGNKTLFVATSKPEIFAKRILKHFSLDKYFKGIYGSRLNGELTDKGELIGHLLKQESILANEAIMVGDREHDILGAKKNNLKSIGVLWGYGSEEELNRAGADYLVATPKDLTEIII